MSVQSSISENIEEDISAEEEMNKSDNDKENEISNSLGVGLDNASKTQSAVMKNEDPAVYKNTDKETLTELKDNITCEVNKKRAHEEEIGLDSNERKRQAIERFSSDEAEQIIREAILIKHVLDEDKSQFNTTNKVEIDKITGERRNGEGYDRYLIDKLLHSEADPSEDTFENIEGIDAGVRDDIVLDESLLDGTEEENNEEDFDVLCAQKDISKDKTASNHSILHKEFDIADAFGENALQTIDEDKELKLYEEAEQEPNENTAENVEDEEGKVHLHEEESKEPETETGTETHMELDDEQIMEKETVEVVAEVVAEAEAETSEDEEEDIGEMTYKQKKAVVAAVRRGNIDLLEDLLDKRHADISMLWYNENLIMVAIRAGQEKMAEFLIDNDVDVTHTTKLIERTEKGEITTYPQTCREMALDKNMDDLVELIDYKTNNLFSFVKPKRRQIRIRRPRPPTPPTPEEPSEDDFTTQDGSQAHDVTRTMEDLILTEEKFQKLESDLDSGLNSSNNAELERKTSVAKSNRVHSESHMNSGENTHRESIAESEGSHISHVFGMDEGYETMSPASPVCAPKPFHQEHNIYGAKEHVSIRGTRASHSAKMHTFKTISNMNHGPKENNMIHSMGPAGHYSRESRRWHQTKSAPPMRSRQSFESIPEIVRTGVPFAHGDKKLHNPTIAKFHSPVISPYSQVVRMLSGSRLLKPKSASSLPSIHNDRANRADKFSIRTETQYIYAGRNNPSLYDRISFLHQPRVSTVGPGISRPRNAW